MTSVSVAQFKFIPPAIAAASLILRYQDGGTIVEFALDDPNSLLELQDPFLQQIQSAQGFGLKVGDRDAYVKWTTDSMEFSFYHYNYNYDHTRGIGTHVAVPSFMSIKIPINTALEESLFAAFREARDYWQAHGSTVATNTAISTCLPEDTFAG